MGIISALALAVIISGGKVEVFGAKFEINSLGSGLEAIAKVFEEHPRAESISMTPKKLREFYLNNKKEKSLKGNDENKNA